MPQYAVLVYSPAPADPMSITPDYLELLNAYPPQVEALGGHITMGWATQPSTTAKSVRAGHINDGTVHPTDLVVAGFYILEAPDDETAVKIAGLNPATRDGAVEVRPLFTPPAVDEEAAPPPELRLELVPIPVSDVDRAKAFYLKAGFDLSVDTQPMPTMRVVQFTPPGSACSIVFGTGMAGISDMVPGSIKGLHLIVKNMTAAREALVARGVEVGEITDVGGVLYSQFEDPDGNLWLLQEFPPEMRQPGQSFYGEGE